MATHGGYDVATIQHLLNAAGYQPPLAEDGSYGPKTQAAVEWYQQGHGLTVDGDVGPQTWGALQGQPGQAGQSAGDASAQASTTYPQYAWAVNDPELGPILRQAASEGWDAARLQGAIYGTTWWKSNSDTGRKAILLQQTDPATWRQNHDSMWVHLQNIGNSMGIEFSQDQLSAFADQAMQFGWDDEQIRHALAAAGTMHGDATPLAQVKQAASDYLINLSPADAEAEARRIAAGFNSIEDYRNTLAGQAKILFAAPQIQKDLDAGLTMKQIAAPFVQIAASTLELSPDAIDFNDPKWNRALNQYDPKTGQATLMTRYDFENMLRTDPQYKFDNTTQAKQAGVGLVSTLAKTFGAIG